MSSREEIERDRWRRAARSRPDEIVRTEYLEPTGRTTFCEWVDTCRVGGARVTPQPGGYYGGWITPEILGPFKGEPGSEGW